MQTLIQDIISEGQDTARRMRLQGMAVPNPCLMYKWHGKAYLGAAHGVVGVLHVRAAQLHVNRHVHACTDEPGEPVALNVAVSAGAGDVDAPRTEDGEWQRYRDVDPSECRERCHTAGPRLGQPPVIVRKLP